MSVTDDNPGSAVPAMDAGTTEDLLEAEGEDEAATPEPSPVQQDHPKLFAGKFKSEEELERGYRELEQHATRLAQRNAEISRLASKAVEKEIPALDGKAITDLIAEDKPEQAINLVLERREREQAKRQQEAEAAWRTAKADEWQRYLLLDPKAIEFDAIIEKQARDSPAEPLAHLVLLLRAEARKTNGGTEAAAERRGAEKVIRAMNEKQELTKLVDASGRSGAPKGQPQLTKTERIVAKETGMTAEEYAQWRGKNP